MSFFSASCFSRSVTSDFLNSASNFLVEVMSANVMTTVSV